MMKSMGGRIRRLKARTAVECFHVAEREPRLLMDLERIVQARTGRTGRLFAVAWRMCRKGTMELHQIRYFLALSKTLNFTRAAEEFNVSQPALSRAISQLEAELGGELFRRESVAMENPTDWRGYLMASAFILVAERPAAK